MTPHGSALLEPALDEGEHIPFTNALDRVVGRTQDAAREARERLERWPHLVDVELRLDSGVRRDVSWC